MNDDVLWVLEARLWLEGSTAHDELLDPACVLVFHGIGTMRLADVPDSLRNAPRWSSVTMSDRVVDRVDDDVIVLAYNAEAKRDGAAPYRCLCTSTWRRDTDGLKLIRHRQIPSVEGDHYHAQGA